MFLIKYILVSVIIFMISFFGLIYNKKSILIILISIELILLSVNILFIVFSIYLDDIVGQIFTIFILTIKFFKQRKTSKPTTKLITNIFSFFIFSINLLIPVFLTILNL